MVSLGDFLKREREAKGVTLEEIASRTRIRLKFLEALEEDRHENLPEPPYVEGFLRSYLAFLGIDSAEAVSNYRVMIQGSPVVPPPPSAPKRTMALSGAAPKIALVILVAALALGGYLVIRGMRTTPVSSAATPVPTATTTPKGIPSPQELASYLKQFEEKPFPLALQTQQETWLRVQIDTDRVVEFTMQPGQSKVLEVRREAIVDIGNAGGVQVRVNGKDFGFLGRPSEVIKGARVTRGGISLSPSSGEGRP